MLCSWFRWSRAVQGKTNLIRPVLLLFTMALAAPALAQSLRTSAPTAANGPTYDVSAGYSYLLSAIPSSENVSLFGFDAGARADFTPHWGVTLDAGYVRTSNVLSTGHSGYVLTFLGGPVYYPLDHGRTRTFLHALVGAGLVDGAVPVSGTTYLHGFAGRPAYALGGGFERSLVGRIGVRLSGDYLRTAFANPSGNIQFQNNLRVTASLVFRLHGGWVR